MKEHIVECADVDCRTEYDRNNRKSCPCCGEKDCQSIDPYEVSEREKNDFELADRSTRQFFNDAKEVLVGGDDEA